MFFYNNGRRKFLAANKAKYNSIITLLQRIKLIIIVTVKVIVSVNEEILNVVIFIKITINTQMSSIV